MTNSPSGPTWYEILGVQPTASADEIKAAWRNATDKFEPGSGSGQFKLFSEAADVLLDPTRRAEYDAAIGVEAAPAAPVETEPVAETTPDVEPFETVAAQPPQEPPVETEPDPIAEPEPAPAADAPTNLQDRLAASFSTVVMICVPVLILAAVLFGVTKGGVHVGDVYLGAKAEQVEASDDGKEAMAAAERALTAVLAYDYRHMDADRTRSIAFLTPKYAQTFTKTFTLLTQGSDGSVGPAVKTKTVVTADVLNTGVVDAEKNRVRVVAFVNQNAVKNGGAPAIFQNRLVVTMVHSGDAWLIDEVKTY